MVVTLRTRFNLQVGPAWYRAIKSDHVGAYVLTIQSTIKVCCLCTGLKYRTLLSVWQWRYKIVE